MELNPHFALNKKVELRLRNRYELIKDEHEPKLIQIFRQRHQVVIQTDAKFITSVSLHNEIFYQINDNSISQDRFVPLELRLAIGKHSYNVFSMIRWRRSENSWSTQLVIGSAIDW